MIHIDRTVKIYDVKEGGYTHTATLQGHEGPVWQVAWAHPKFGVVLGSASFDGSVQIHREARAGEWTCVFSGAGLHESSVNGVAFGPHEFGLVAAGASSDGRVSILTYKEDDSWSVDYIRDNGLGVNALSWAPYGSCLDMNENGQEQLHQPRLVTGGCDNRIRFWTKSLATNTWEEESYELDTSTYKHSDWIRDVAWAPSVLPGVDMVASCSEDKTVLIWTCGGGDDDDEEKKWTPTLLHTFDAPVWRLSWSVTGSILAVSSGDSNVTLWKSGLNGDWTQVSSVPDAAPAISSSSITPQQ
jgi:protein transport protein SEC13